MWVPLHQHSQYSILDGACPVESLARRASEMKMGALALTDHGNMHGAIDFYKACLAHSVKPIIGCEFYVAPTSRFEKKKVASRTSYHLVLLAKDIVGYRNLSILSSLGYTEGFYYHPRIDKELLVKHREGLICLSACLSSEVATLALQGSVDEFHGAINWYKELFGEDYYLEMQRHVMEEEELALIDDAAFHALYQDAIGKQVKLNSMLKEASERFSIRCVATNDTHYMDKKDYFAHEILINIQSGEPIEVWEKDSSGEPKFRTLNPKRRMYGTHACYFKSPEEMQALFLDIPEAISNTLEVAAKCNLKLDFEKKHYPLYIPDSLKGEAFDAKKQAQEVERTLRSLCEEGIAKRYTKERLDKVAQVYSGSDPMEVVRKRLDYELSIILSKGMADYLLVVWDIIHGRKAEASRWAQEGVLGPVRSFSTSSVLPTSSLLLFISSSRRFINPERISYPDIDVDICMEGRSRVIDYTVQKYGKDNRSPRSSPSAP